MNNTDLREKIYSGERVEADEACALFEWELPELGRAACYRLGQVDTTGTVPFIIDRIINYTNICEAGCSFCAFHARAGVVRPYTLTQDEIMQKVAELDAAGGSQVMLQGGLNSEYTLDYFVDLVRMIRKQYPGIFLHSFSPAEIVFFSRNNNCTVDQVIEKLHEAGVNSVPGASDLLVPRIRNMVSPRKITVREWLAVMYALNRQGMKSSATMTYGMGETLTERVEHLAVIRELQDETGMIRAFIPWSFSPLHTQYGHVRPAGGADFLRTVAVARIFLDNVYTIQAGWLTEGLDMAQLALSFGANDMGGVLTEEVVVKATGIDTQASVESFVSLVRNAGKVPVLRDSEYREIKRFDT